MDRAPGLAVCGLGDIGQVVFDLLAHRLGAFLAADPRVDAAHVPDRAQVALDEEARGGIGIAAVSVFEDLALAGDKGVEVVRRDELVLGAVDEPHQVAVEPLTGVIDQGQARPDVPDEQELTDAVQHIGPRRQPTSGPDSVSTRWQKLWKFATVTRAAVAAPTASSIRSRSSRAALTL